MLHAELDDGKLVLVVDDDSSARQGLCKLLDARGYRAMQAENGQIALQLLKRMPHFPCLVVLDLAMPVMDGAEFLSVYAQDPILRHIPVVIVSGNMRRRSDKPFDGVYTYLSKPVNVDCLLKIIDQHCRS
jgi:CheY-like chemotaxis protein